MSGEKGGKGGGGKGESIVSFTLEHVPASSFLDFVQVFSRYVFKGMREAFVVGCAGGGGGGGGGEGGEQGDGGS